MLHLMDPNRCIVIDWAHLSPWPQECLKLIDAGAELAGLATAKDNNHGRIKWCFYMFLDKSILLWILDISI